MSKKHIVLQRSEFAEKFLYLNGQPFSLADYPHMLEIYNSQAREIVMHFSRQTAKSTTLANLCITNCATQPYFKILYISPTRDQTQVFSRDRVTPTIEGSSFIKDFYTSPTLVQNVYTKQFLNGSMIYMRYAGHDADRIRGLSADMNLFDELQDLKADVIPVIQETTSRSNFKRHIYVGTPKTSRSTLGKYWRDSTQCEYLIKCNSCNHWNLLGEDNIAIEGLVCSKCNNRLSMSESEGEWVSTYSQTQEPPVEGFRVCALHFAEAPWVNWKIDIIQKRERTSKQVFLNETLAIEYDSGSMPITEMQLKACCGSEEMQFSPDRLAESYETVLGIDYGPQNSEKSYTTVTIVQKRLSKYHVLYMKKFIGKEADYSFIHKEIPRLYKEWGCLFIAADHGMGEASNSEIRSRIGNEKLVAFLHNKAQKKPIEYNKNIGVYILNRTTNMDRLFTIFKQRKIELPTWDTSHEFLEDILNIRLTYAEDEQSYSYTNEGPDDFFHSLLFAITALDLYKKDLTY